MCSGSAGGTVHQMWRIVPGPSMSASTACAPGPSSCDGAPLRPSNVLPPAPRSPVGFSKRIDRLSSVGSRREGSGHITSAEPSLGAMKLSGLHHVSLCVTDEDEAVKFYTEVFGFEVLPRPDFG